MAKTKPVKWALGGDEPEDLQDFLSNDDIERKHGRPPKSKYRFAVRRLQIREIQNGDNAGENRISAMLVIKEDKKSDQAKYNGWLVWDGFNVTDQGAPFIKRFLKSLGLTWDDFIKKTKQDDQDPPHIVQIGRVKFETGDDPIVTATTGIRNNRQTDEPEVVIRSYVPKDEDDDDDEDDEPDEDDAATESFDTEDESGDEPDEDEEEPWTREDLEDEDWDTVSEVAKDDFGYTAKSLKKFKEDVGALLDDMEEQGHLSGSGDDDDEDDDDDGDEHEVAEAALREELAGKGLNILRKRAVRNEVDTEGMKKADLIDAIVEAELPPF